MPVISHQGATIHYLDVGKGLPVLLLHAFPLHGGMFQPQIAALSGKYRLIVPDQRGFGQSSLGEAPSEMTTLALDALAILDALDLRSAVIGGASMGGYVSMAMLRHDPGRVRALVLINTRATADDAQGIQQREKNAQATSLKGMQFLVETMLPKLLSPRASPTLRAQVGRMILENNPRGAAAALRGMATRGDSTDILARFGGMALVAVGEHDAFTPVEEAERIRSLIQDSKLVVIPGAGHLSNLENPEAFNRVLEDLLAAAAS